MVQRIPISFDGSLDAYPVASSTLDDLDHCGFQSCIRNRKPLILIGGAQNWLGLSEDSGAIQKIFEAVDDCEEDMLVALDGRNFLKHGLCLTRLVDLKTGMKSILNREAIFSHSIVEAEFVPPTSIDSESTMVRKYIRTYFDMHQNLLREIDIEYLRNLILGPEVRDTIHKSTEDSISPFKLKNMGLWISSEGCITPLHFDLCHGFLAQIVGRKTFLLASSSETSLLRYWKGRKTNNTKNGTTSPIDLSLWLDGDKAERARYPLVDETAWFIASLGPGDILYTPPGWWHYVISDTTSVSVLIPFDPQPSKEALPMNVLTA